MNGNSEFVESLRQRGIQIWAENDKLYYKARKGALNPDEITRLKNAKSDLVAILSREAPSEELRARRHGSFESISVPLTFQQRLYWEACEEEPVWTHNGVTALRLLGNLSAPSIRHAFEQLVWRHDTLRSSIEIISETPQLRIDPPKVDVLEIMDFGRMPAQEAEMLVEQKLTSAASEVGSLAGRRLFAAQLIILNPRESVLIVSIHHIITDGWALMVMFKELWTLYGASLRGDVAPLRENPPRYADYAVWQRSNHQRWVEEHGKFWRDHLAGASPLRWPELTKETTQGDGTLPGTAEFSMGILLSTLMRDAARRNRVSLGMLILTAYAIMAAKSTGQRDMVIASAYGGRDRPEHEEMLGYMAECLYIRVHLHSETSLGEFLNSVAEEFYRVLPHHGYGRIENRSASLAAQSLFQWLPYSFDDMRGVPSEDEQGRMTLEVTRVFPKAPAWLPESLKLMFVFFDATDAVKGRVYHDRKTFSDSTVSRFVDELRKTVELISREPSAPLSMALK